MANKNLTLHNDTFNNDGVTNNFTTIYGFGGNDIITTAVASATIYGGLGNDSITSTLVSGSRDYLYGGLGIDTIVGGAGNDYVFGGFGNDVITSGGGNDTLSGDAGNDIITGGQGNQTLYGGMGDDSVSGGLDNKTLPGGVGGVDIHLINGDAGNDIVNGATYASTGAAATLTLATGSATNSFLLYGGIGSDTLNGSWFLTGGSGAADTMDGGLGTNAINGGGSISITGSGASQVLTTVAGANHANETVTFASDLQGALVSGVAGVNALYAGVTANLAAGTATASGTGWAISDTISNVDNLTGSLFNDALTGNLLANVIRGGLGNDTIDGGGLSNSTLAGGANTNTGNDVLYGGGGNNTFILHSGTNTADAIVGGTNIDTLNFSNVFFTAGTAATNSLPTGDTIKAFTVLANTYTVGTIEGVDVNLNSGMDANSVLNFTGGAGSGSISGVEKVIGTSGTDYMIATGASTLSGGLGNDTLVAGDFGNGAEVLNGGLGNNIYDGTPTSNVPVYFGITNGGATTLMTQLTAATKEFDTIYGFAGGANDKLYVSAANFNNFGLGAISQTHAVGNVDVGTMFTEHYNALGKLASLTLDATGVTTLTTATMTGSAAHNEFVFNSTTGDLFYVTSGQNLASLTGTVYSGTGSNGGTLTASNNAIAHIDISQFSSAHTSGAAIDNTDFILVV